MNKLDLFGTKAEQRIVYDQEFLNTFERRSKVIYRLKEVSVNVNSQLNYLLSGLTVHDFLSSDELKQSITSSFEDLHTFVLSTMNKIQAIELSCHSKLWELPDPPTTEEIERLYHKRIASFSTTKASLPDNELNKKFMEFFSVQLRRCDESNNTNHYNSFLAEIRQFADKEANSLDLAPEDVFTFYAEFSRVCTVLGRHNFKIMTETLGVVCSVLKVQYNFDKNILVAVSEVSSNA